MRSDRQAQAVFLRGIPVRYVAKRYKMRVTRVVLVIMRQLTLLLLDPNATALRFITTVTGGMAAPAECSTTPGRTPGVVDEYEAGLGGEPTDVWVSEHGDGYRVVSDLFQLIPSTGCGK